LNLELIAEFQAVKICAVIFYYDYNAWHDAALMSW